MKEKVKISIKLKLFLFRLGVAFLALLTLHALVTIYKQIIEANEILNQLTGSAMIPSSYQDHSNDETKYFSLPNYREQTYITKKPVKKRESILHSNPKAKKQNGNGFRARFQESVFSYERRFYEADHTPRPTYFEEINQSLREGRGRNSKNVGKTDQENKVRSIRSNDGYESKNRIINNKGSIVNKTEDNNFDGNNKNNVNNKNDDNDNNNDNNNKNNLKHNKPHDNIKEKKENEPKRGKTKQSTLPSKVLIMAYRRSGSSFIGEMFNRNPRVFYLFEPIFPVEKIAGKGKYPLLYDTLVGNLLDVIYTCSFNKHPFLVDFFSNSPFRLQSMALKNSTCEINATSKNMPRQCKPLDWTVFKTLCNAKDHIAVKTIRTSSKRTVEHFFDAHADLNRLNLIHLVRDPRAIINSRLYLYLRSINYTAELREDKNFANALRRSVRVASANLCSRIQSDLKYGQQAGSDHYMLLRYEDAAMQPLKIYERISKFVRIKQSAEVIDWLKENTKAGRGENNDYSTSRNSTAAVYGWRKKLPYKLVTEIQSQCYDVMKRLGYLHTASERDLIDVTKSLVTAYDTPVRSFLHSK